MAIALRTAMKTLQLQTPALQRSLHVSAVAAKCQSGRYRVTRMRTRPLTYEMANKPHLIADRKSWNSFNTANILDGNRPSETAVEDVLIRRFMTGTWHNLFVAEIIIKRQHNIVRICGIIRQGLAQRKMYFLIGYTEELLSYILQCPIKLELQSVASKEDVIFKYI